MYSEPSDARPIKGPIATPADEPPRRRIVVRWSGTGWTVEALGVPGACAHVDRLDQAKGAIRSEIARVTGLPEELVILSPYLTILPARPAEPDRE